MVFFPTEGVDGTGVLELVPFTWVDGAGASTSVELSSRGGGGGGGGEGGGEDEVLVAGGEVGAGEEPGGGDDIGVR